jgi:hypothetical protein
MVLEQTINIPADRRVFFEFLAPQELPAGPARVELKVTPVDEEQHGTEANAEEQAVKSATPITDRLSGVAAHLGDITLEQIREERLSKYDVENTVKLTPALKEKFAELAARLRNNPSKLPTPHADALSGVAAHLGDITLEQIREERRRKYML